MNRELSAVAETLAREFEDLRASCVIRVLTDCAEELPDDGQHLIEQAARGRLLRLRGGQPGRRPDPVRDALDVSLHDDDLAHEVELMTHLMVAANESDRRLAQPEVDRLLGLSSSCVRSALPRQRRATVHSPGIPGQRDA